MLVFLMQENILYQLQNVFLKVFTAYFSNTSNDIDDKTDQKFANSNKILVITCLLMGNITWCFYCGFLTSQLTIPLEKYPFHDLESFLKSDFQLKMMFKSLENYFSEAEENSIHRKIYETKINIEDYKNNDVIDISLYFNDSTSTLKSL